MEASAKSNEEISGIFTDWFNSIVDFHICLHNYERLDGPLQLEGELVVRRLGFFWHYKKVVVSHLAINLCKLFSDNPNQKISFHKFRNKLKGGHYADVKDKFSEAEWNSLIATSDQVNDRIASQEELIKTIRDFRDKVYAHKDLGEFKGEIPKDGMRELVASAMEIYNLYGHHFEVGYGLLNFVDHWKVDDVLAFASDN